jgi:hypothetical protein
MLPKLRIILAAVFATCAAVLALSAGMLGARAPGDDLAGVPEVSRTLVRQGVVAEPDRQQLQLLAYSRRADELLRLRDLPVTPARAVVDYAERAQARAAETASAPAVPAATSPTDSVTGPAAAASDPAPTEAASAPAAPEDAPAAPAADSAASATPPTDALPPATIAMVVNQHGDTTVAPGVVPPASPPPAPSVTMAPGAARDAAAAAPAAVETPAPSAPESTASGDTRIAAVQTGGSETAEMYGPEKPKADAKPRHRAKVAHPHPSKPKKKTQVVVVNPRAAPAPSTGFPVNEPNNRNAVNQPNNRSTGVGGWRYGSTGR